MCAYITNNKNTIAPGMSVKFIKNTIAVLQFELKTDMSSDKIFTVTKVNGLWCSLFWMDQISKQTITYQTLLTNMEKVETSNNICTEERNSVCSVVKLCRIKRTFNNNKRTFNNNADVKNMANASFLVKKNSREQTKQF